MGTITIIDGALALPISDAKQVAALAPLDTNHDGQVKIDDLQRASGPWGGG